MNQKDICPVCGFSGAKTRFLQRYNVPVHQNLVINQQQSAIKINRGDLDLVVCEKCEFIFNQAFDITKLNYGEFYENTQTYSPYFSNYINDIIKYLVYEKKVQNSTIIEVGCGKGLFLKKLVEVTEWKNTGYGFDPSYVGEETYFEGRLKYAKNYYNSDCAYIPADVIICRHVIEHIPNPLVLLRTVRQALINSPNARVFFETPCVEWILRNQVIWDFFYEHCSYFTVNSLTTAFANSDFKVETVKYIFKDQYLWLEARLGKQKEIIINTNNNIPVLANKFALAEQELQNIWKQKIKKLTAEGKIAIWGAGAKGVTLANLIDPDQQLISYVIDLNPKKQGHYLPGTGHPIVSYQQAASKGVKNAILMNPNYYEENLSLLRQANLQMNLIEL